MSGDPSDTQRFLPLGLDVRSKSCLVVGGGNVGTRKVLTLVQAGADVTVVAPAVTEEIAERVAAGTVRWVQDSFGPEHATGALLIVAATDDDECNAAVVEAASRNRALVCDASSAERSQVIFGALLETDDVSIAVFSGGRDPSLARRTRDLVAELLGREHEPKREP